MTPYQYVNNNPVNLIDPTGMKGEDWIYDKKTEKYHWDGSVNMPSDITNDNHEYVGTSLDDVEKHHKENNPVMSYLTGATFGSDLNGSWPGEITQKNESLVDKWESSENILAQITYGTVNDIYIAGQVFNPFVKKNEIKTIGGYGTNSNDLNDAGISFVSSFSPNGLATQRAQKLLKVLNASQFSKLFKGSMLTQTSPAKRGVYNKNINKAIRFINRKTDDYRGYFKGLIEDYAPFFEKKEMINLLTYFFRHYIVCYLGALVRYGLDRLVSFKKGSKFNLSMKDYRNYKEKGDQEFIDAIIGTVFLMFIIGLSVPLLRKL